MSEKGKALDDFVLMRKFIDEYSHAVGPRSMSNLPDPSALPYKTVTLPKDTLVRFRNDFMLLVCFACCYCDVPPEKLCALDLLSPFLRDLQKSEEML